MTAVPAVSRVPLGAARAVFAIAVVVTVATAMRALAPWVDRATASAAQLAARGDGVPYEAIAIGVIAFGLCSTVLMLVTALLIYRTRSRGAFGLVVAYNSVVLAFLVIGPWMFAPASGLDETLTRIVSSTAFVTLLWATLAFPDGRFVPRWTWWLVPPFAAWQVARVLRPDLGFERLGWPWPLVFMAFYSAGGLAQGYRYLRIATPEQRVQLKWWVFGSNVLIAFYVFAIAGRFVAAAAPADGDPSFWFAGIGPTGFHFAVASAVASYLGNIVFAVCLTVSILRFAWFGIDVVVSRTLAYAASTSLIVGAFAAISIAISRTVGPGAGLGSDVALTFAVAAALGIAFVPLRRLAEKAADRLVAQHADLALLFVDIVGSTSRLAEMGDRSWAAALARFQAAVRREFDRHEGQEITTAGDDFFATFPTAADAVAAARGIRRAMAEIGLDVRIGIHAGRCELRGRQPIGVNVHVAARLERLAAPGEIVVSEAVVARLPAGTEGLRDLGRQALRGVPGDWQVFALAPG